ncbi:hypothetical protein Ciccas_006708, partial [Cichlidogyrus casuarinus]
MTDSYFSNELELLLALFSRDLDPLQASMEETQRILNQKDQRITTLTKQVQHNQEAFKALHQQLKVLNEKRAKRPCDCVLLKSAFTELAHQCPSSFNNLLLSFSTQPQNKSLFTQILQQSTVSKADEIRNKELELKQLQRDSLHWESKLPKMQHKLDELEQLKRSPESELPRLHKSLQRLATKLQVTFQSTSDEENISIDYLIRKIDNHIPRSAPGPSDGLVKLNEKLQERIHYLIGLFNQQKMTHPQLVENHLPQQIVQLLKERTGDHVFKGANSELNSLREYYDETCDTLQRAKQQQSDLHFLLNEKSAEIERLSQELQHVKESNEHNFFRGEQLQRQLAEAKLNISRTGPSNPFRSELEKAFKQVDCLQQKLLVHDNEYRALNSVCEKIVNLDTRLDCMIDALVLGQSKHLVSERTEVAASRLVNWELEEAPTLDEEVSLSYEAGDAVPLVDLMAENRTLRLRLADMEDMILDNSAKTLQVPANDLHFVIHSLNEENTSLRAKVDDLTTSRETLAAKISRLEQKETKDVYCEDEQFVTCFSASVQRAAPVKTMTVDKNVDKINKNLIGRISYLTQLLNEEKLQTEKLREQMRERDSLPLQRLRREQKRMTELVQDLKQSALRGETNSISVALKQDFVPPRLAINKNPEISQVFQEPDIKLEQRVETQVTSKDINKQLVRKLEQLELQNEILKQEAIELCIEVKTREQTQKERIARIENKARKISHRLGVLTEANENLADALDKDKKKSLELIEQLKREKVQSQYQIDSLNKRVQVAGFSQESKQVDKLERKMLNVSHRLDSTTKRVESVMRRKFEENELHKQESGSMKQQIDSYENVTNSMNAKIAILEQEKENLIESNEVSKARNVELEEERSQIISENEIMSHEIERLRVQVKFFSGESKVSRVVAVRNQELSSGNEQKERESEEKGKRMNQKLSRESQAEFHQATTAEDSEQTAAESSQDCLDEEQLVLENHELKTTLDAVKAEMVEKERDNETIRSQLGEFAVKVEEATLRVASLESELERERRENQNLAKTSESWKCGMDLIKSELSREKQIRAEREMELEDQILQLKAQIESMEMTKNSELAEQIDRVERQREKELQMGKQLEELQTELQELLAKKRINQKQLEDDNKALVSTLEACKLELETLREERVKQKMDPSELEIQPERVSHVGSTPQSQESETLLCLRTDVEHLSTENQSLVASLESSNQELQKAKQSAQSQLLQIQKLNLQLEDDNKALVSTLEACKLEQETLREERVKQKMDPSELEIQPERVSHVGSTPQSQESETLHCLRTDVEHLSTENQCLVASLESSNQELEKVKQNAQSQLLQIQKLNLQLEQNQNSLKEESKLRDNVEQQNKEIMTKLQGQNDQLATLRNEIVALNEQSASKVEKLDATLLEEARIRSDLEMQLVDMQGQLSSMVEIREELVRRKQLQDEQNDSVITKAKVIEGTLTELTSLPSDSELAPHSLESERINLLEGRKRKLKKEKSKFQNELKNADAQIKSVIPASDTMKFGRKEQKLECKNQPTATRFLTRNVKMLSGVRDFHSVPYEALQKELADALMNESKMKRKLDSQSDQITHLKNELNGVKHESAKLQLANSVLEKTIEQMEQEKGLEARVESSSSENEEETCHSTEKQKRKKKKKHCRGQKRIPSLNTLDDSRVKTLEEMIRKRDEEIEKLQSEMQDKRKESDDEDVENDEDVQIGETKRRKKKKRSRGAKVSVTELQNLLHSAKDQEKQLKHRIEDQSHEIHKMKLKLVQNQDQAIARESLEQKLMTSEIMTRELTEKVARLYKEREQLQNQLLLEQSRGRESQSEMDSLRLRIKQGEVVEAMPGSDESLEECFENSEEKKKMRRKKKRRVVTTESMHAEEVQIGCPDHEISSQQVESELDSDQLERLKKTNNDLQNMLKNMSAEKESLKMPLEELCLEEKLLESSGNSVKKSTKISESQKMLQKTQLENTQLLETVSQLRSTKTKVNDQSSYPVLQIQALDESEAQFVAVTQEEAMFDGHFRHGNAPRKSAKIKRQARETLSNSASIDFDAQIAQLEKEKNELENQLMLQIMALKEEKQLMIAEIESKDTLWRKQKEELIEVEEESRKFISM